jgi:hypothetical protein
MNKSMQVKISYVMATVPPNSIPLFQPADRIIHFTSLPAWLEENSRISFHIHYNPIKFKVNPNIRQKEVSVVWFAWVFLWELE